MENSHWITKCKAFDNSSLYELEKQLNDFYQGKSIIASRLYYVNEAWYCIVYYKIKEGTIIPELKREKELSFDDLIKQKRDIINKRDIILNNKKK